MPNRKGVKNKKPESAAGVFLLSQIWHQALRIAVTCSPKKWDAATSRRATFSLVNTLLCLPGKVYQRGAAETPDQGLYRRVCQRIHSAPARAGLSQRGAVCTDVCRRTFSPKAMGSKKDRGSPEDQRNSTAANNACPGRATGSRVSTNFIAPCRKDLATAVGLYG